MAGKIAKLLERITDAIEHEIREHRSYGGATSVDEAINLMSNSELLEALIRAEEEHDMLEQTDSL